jgi:hypothetical protein
MSFRIMSRAVTSDFAFRELDTADGRDAATYVREHTAPFPAAGTRARQVVDGLSGAGVVRV